MPNAWDDIQRSPESRPGSDAELPPRQTTARLLSGLVGSAHFPAPTAGCVRGG